MMTGCTRPANWLIHQYTAIGTSYFTSTDGLGRCLGEPGRQRPQRQQRGARHHDRRPQRPLCHRRHDGRQQHARRMPWTGPPSGPAGRSCASLHMSRDKAIVAARIEMDQAMESAVMLHRSTGPGHLLRPAADPGPVEGRRTTSPARSSTSTSATTRHRATRTHWAYSKPHFDKSAQW